MPESQPAPPDGGRERDGSGASRRADGGRERAQRSDGGRDRKTDGGRARQTNGGREAQLATARGAVPDDGAPELAIITGMSGAGRTTAAKVLEDLGYFVIDNMPPSLIHRVVELGTARGSEVARIALVVDVRGQEFFGDLRESLAALRHRGLDPRILFLEAADDVLVRRYEAERRAHPLAGRDRVSEGIRRERELLADLRAEADLVIDTTQMSVHDLRDRITDALGRHAPGMAVNIVSFGFKHGTPRDADIVLDVRFLPNPHWVDDLRPFTGTDAPVRDYVLGQDATAAYLERLFALFDLMVPAFVREGKHYLTVAIGCTGGRHRSVVLAEELARHIETLGVEVQVNHRDRSSRPPSRDAAGA